MLMWAESMVGEPFQLHLTVFILTQTLDDTNKAPCKTLGGGTKMQVEETGGSWMSSMDIIDLVLERLVSTWLQSLPFFACEQQQRRPRWQECCRDPALPGGCPPTFQQEQSSHQSIKVPASSREILQTRTLPLVHCIVAKEQALLPAPLHARCLAPSISNPLLTPPPSPAG